MELEGVTRVGAFLEWDGPGVRCVGLESSQLEACLHEAKRRQVSGVFGSGAYGFNESDLSFLPLLPWLTHVWFWQVKLRSIDGLYALEKLQYFGVHPKRPPINFSKFPLLERVALWPRPGDGGLAELQHLRRLFVSNYHPPAGSVDELHVPNGITELNFTQCSIASLAGLPLLPNLRRLQIAHCRRLRSLDDLHEIAPALEHLVVSQCRVERPPDLARLKALRFCRCRWPGNGRSRRVRPEVTARGCPEQKVAG